MNFTLHLLRLPNRLSISLPIGRSSSSNLFLPRNDELWLVKPDHKSPRTAPALPRHLSPFINILFDIMPTFGGLRVEIQNLGAVNDTTSFEEYESSECVNRSSGRSSHCMLRLPCEIPFQILVLAEHSFQWDDANALKVNIDFDNGEEVNDAEVFVAKRVTADKLNIPCLSRTLTGQQYTQLSQITRQIKPFKKETRGGAADIVDQELVSFKTVALRFDTGRLANIRNEGTIKVAIYSCQVHPTKRPRASLGVSLTKRMGEAQASANALVAAGICSKIALFDRMQQVSVPHDFRSTNSALAGVFIFHYRIPGEYDRTKASDQAEYYIQDAGPGKRKVIDKTPKRDKSFTSGEIRSFPRAPAPSTAAEYSPPHAGTETQAEDDDTIIVMTNDNSVDNMDINELESAVSPDDSVTDPQSNADLIDIITDLEGLNDLNYSSRITATELEFVIDRERELRAEVGENESLMQEEYFEALKRVRHIREEERREAVSRAEEEWRQVMDKAEAEAGRKVEQRRQEMESRSANIKHVYEEVDHPKVEVIRLEAYQNFQEEEHEKLAKQVKHKYDELVKRVADTRGQRDVENRVLEKAKKQRLSAVRGGHSGTTE